MNDLRTEISIETSEAATKYYDNLEKMTDAKKNLLEIKHNVTIDSVDEGTYIYSHDPASEYGWKVVPGEWLTDLNNFDEDREE